MLPFILGGALGGVALAATQYGLKKFFDDKESKDDCLYDNVVPCQAVENAWLDFEHMKYHFPLFYSSILSELQNIIYETERLKTKLYQTSVTSLHTELSKIKNLPLEVKMPPYIKLVDKYTFKVANDDVKAIFEEQNKMLTQSKQYIDSKLDKLTTIIPNSNDFLSYGEDDKELIENLIVLNNAINDATCKTMTSDGETLSRDVKKAFEKIKTIIS
jgi:hypothetical protein